jgi:group II intron reverse transcriptase/maturase
MVLESIYEQDFLPCSHGFRPRRSAHGALDELWKEAMNMGGCWVLEVDIKSYFDTLDHGHLRTFLDRRVRDGVIRRAIDKWLTAGVMKDGSYHSRLEGTPQGGVISPLLANIYLHEVLDVWFEREVKSRLSGRARLIRYADDFVILFTSEVDARRVWEVLPKRFGKYGLTLHPEKTKLVKFHRPPDDPGSACGSASSSGTFDLLGFTHFWGKTRKGNWAVRRKTMRARLARAVRAISTWCREHLHWPVPEQRRTLNAKLRGHYQYYGITGNYRCLAAFAYLTTRLWRRWLNRRSQRQSMPWPRFAVLLKRLPLLRPRIIHSALSRAANPSP